MEDEAKLTVRLDANLLNRFHIVARKERKSVSEIIREFVDWYVVEAEKEKK